MKQIKFKPSDALKEHLLGGGKTSILEAQVMFGVSMLSRNRPLEESRIILQRKNAANSEGCKENKPSLHFAASDNLPAREIMVSEYWIENI